MSDRLTTADGVLLEHRWDRPNEPVMAAVFCHPDPKQDGTMDAPLMRGVAKHLALRGAAVLRFNFRGVGASTGTHGEGLDEVSDVEAAVAEADRTGLPLALIGWSFGAATALRWLARSGRSLPYVGIAPPSLGLPENLPPGRRRIIVGERDQVIDVASLTAYASRIGADLVTLPADHFFYFQEAKLAGFIWDFLTAADRTQSRAPPR